MDDEAILHEAIRRQPDDHLAWLALADWLEENGQSRRAELLRLWRQTRVLSWTDQQRRTQECTLAEMLLSGVKPTVPQLTNSVGMEFVLVPAGVFRLGTDSGDQNDELPQIDVEFAQPYYIGVAPVTQIQFRRVTRQAPSHFRKGGRQAGRVMDLKTDDFPVDSVNWIRADSFCQRLSERPEEKQAGRVYRLPTEAEWAYAARSAGSCSSAFLFGEGLTSVVANFNGESPGGKARKKGGNLGRPSAVGTYPPNALGMVDVTGNVWEWVDDWHTSSYDDRSRFGAKGPSHGSSRVLRGGSWSSAGWGCRLEYRNCVGPSAGNENFGFRVLLEWKPPT